MENCLINFLNDYVEKPSVLLLSDLNEIEIQKLPRVWISILSNENKKLDTIKKEWSQFKDDLSLVYEYICNNLISLDLAFFDDNYHLIYGLKSTNDGEILYYQASNPKNILNHNNFNKMPEQLKKFYSLQNGWFYLASGTMGIMPIEETFHLNEYDWEILENSELDFSSINLKNNIAIFSNGMGGHISFDERLGELKSMIWWSEEEPTLDIDFWAVLDTWIRFGFDG